MSLPIVHRPNGSSFYATERHAPEVPPFGGMTEEALLGWITARWEEAREGKRAETNRLKTCSLYYDGFHYADAAANRHNVVTNYCFSAVETVVPLVTESVPRPEIVPRRSMASDRVNRLQETASWLMDLDGFDDAVVCGTRDKCKFGWNAYLITFDPKTGMPFPRNMSVFDVYLDPYCTHPDFADYIFIARPISTAWLRGRYPHLSEQIMSDGLASPSWDVNIRPFQEAYQEAGRVDESSFATSAPRPVKEGETSTGTARLVMSTDSRHEKGGTTMVYQMVIRDESLMKVTYLGEEHGPDGAVVSGMHHHAWEQVYKSGWCVALVTSNGTFLRDLGQDGTLGPPTKELDECYCGLPVEFGRRYPQTDRFYGSPGDIDHIIPLNRSVNRRKALINRALELAANPPAVTNRDSGLPNDYAAISGGDVLRINRGSDIKWMEFRGPNEQQFEQSEIDRRDTQIVSGIQDALAGARPAGIEAASAIRQLRSDASARIRAMENPGNRERARLLKKIMVCAGKKLAPSFVIMSSKGDMVSVSSDDLLDEYDIRFAPGSGTAAAKGEFEEKAFALFDRGALDEQALLEAVDWRGREQIIERIELRKQQEMVVAALSAQNGASDKENGSKGGGGSKKTSTANVGRN